MQRKCSIVLKTILNFLCNECFNRIQLAVKQNVLICLYRRRPLRYNCPTTRRKLNTIQLKKGWDRENYLHTIHTLRDSAFFHDHKIAKTNYKKEKK